VKIAFISDTHFGFSRPKREYDSYIYAKQVFEIAKEKADLIFLPGDVFDSSSPGEECLSRVFELFQSFQNSKSDVKIISLDDKWQHNGHGILNFPIVAIPGTHEYKAREDGPLEVLENAGYITCLHAGHITLELGGEKVNIFGIRGVPELVAKDVLKKLDFKPQGGTNILVMHQSFKELLPFNDEMVATLEFKDLPDGFDLFVNGHIHSHKVFELDNGKFVLPGYTVITQVRKGEVKQRKGFVVYDTISKALEFVEIPLQRDYIYKEVDISDFESSISDLDGLDRKSYSIFGKELTLEPYAKIKLVGKIDEHKKNILNLVKKKEGIILDIEKDLSVIEQKIKEIDLKAIKESALGLAEQTFFENLYGSGFKRSFDLKLIFDYLKDGEVDKVLEYLDES